MVSRSPHSPTNRARKTNTTVNNNNNTVHDRTQAVLDKAYATWSRFMDTSYGQKTDRVVVHKNPFEQFKRMETTTGGVGVRNAGEGNTDFRFSLTGNPGRTSRPMPLPHEIISQFR